MRHTAGWAKRTAALAAMALLVGACGGGNDNGGGDTTDGDGTPQRGGRVVYGLRAETPSGWCLPETELDTAGATVARAVYDPLTVQDEKGGYVPYLAESVTPNAANDEWTISLRKGVKFHDGTDLTPTVVKNNLDAFRGAYPARKPLLFAAVYDNIADVSVVGENVVVKMKAPWSAFPAYLYFNGRFGIMAQAQLDDQKTCNRALIGTGPFKMKDWVVNSHFTAVRNPDYWQKAPDGQALPYLDEIQFKPVIEDAPRLNSVQSGDLDMAFFDTYAGAAQMGRVRTLSKSNDIRSIINGDLTEVGYVIFQAGKAPFNNINARKAVALAIDSKRISELRAEGELPIANGPFAPGNAGYLKDTGYPGFNLDEAKAAAAAYQKDTGKPLTFTLNAASDSGSVSLAQLVKEQVEKTGAKVTLQPVELAQNIEQALAGAFEASMWLNHPGGDPDTQLLWWHSQSPLNFGRVADAELDALLEAGRTKTDPDERRKTYEDVNRLFASKLYNAWMHWNQYAVATTNRVNGVLGGELPGGAKPSKALVGGHNLAGIWVAAK